MNKLTLQSKWVFSKKEDLLWVIFPSLIGFLIIGLYFFMTGYLRIKEQMTVLVLYLTWALLFDGTHAFATYSRTYFDKQFYSDNKKMLLRSLLVFIIGPIFISFFYFLNNSVDDSSIAFIIFNRFAICYAYYHLIRQHWGFIVIYRKKNGEPDDITRKLDGLLLTFGSIFPFLHGQIHNIKVIHLAETLKLPLEKWETASYVLFVTGIIVLIFTFFEKLNLKKLGLNIIAIIMIVVSIIILLIKNFTLSKILTIASTIAALSFIITLVYYLFIIVKNKSNPFQNKPKWILLSMVLVSYNIAFHLDIPILILIAAITVFHNVQYHKIINFHNVNKYKKEEKQKYGFAVVLAQKVSVFILLALLFNLFSYVPRIASNVLVSDLMLNYILSSFFWGVAFHHYYLDSVIWRIKGNNDLNNNLKIV